MENIDNIAFLTLLSILGCAIICPSEIIGGLSLCFSGLVIFGFVFSNQKQNYNLELYEKAIILFFLIVTVSLLGSTLFKLSLHGYIKTVIYILFYFCCAVFFNKNYKKIPYLLFFVVCLMSFESFVAIFQNYSGVDEISGWQDTTNINPEEIISRAYGTLKPYNPNLLAGYLLAGLSGFVYFILTFLKQNKKRIALGFSILFLINLIAIIDTGCRGAYLGFALFFPALFFGILYYVQKKLGGLSNIKKRYKNIALSSIIGIMAFSIFNPAISKRFSSIFALRADSSISFRLNVYESVIQMIKDNFFLGIGVGNQNFREIYGLYMKTGFDALGAYCVPLEITVESGIFALIAFCCIILFSLLKSLKICKSDNYSTQSKILALAVFLMILAVMGHGLFDTIWFRPQVQILFWTYIAMLKGIKAN